MMAGVNERVLRETRGGSPPELTMANGLRDDSPKFETKYILPLWRVSALTTWLGAHTAPDTQYAHGHIRTLYFDTGASVIKCW